MSLVQSINDLTGAPTMVEGQRRLNRVYQDLVQAKKPALAKKVNTVRNDFNSYLCETTVNEGPGIFGPGGIIDQKVTGKAPACYRQDQAIPGKLKAKLRRLSEELRKTSPTSGEMLDPDKETGIAGELETELPGLPLEVRLLVAAGVLLAVWNLTR